MPAKRAFLAAVLAALIAASAAAAGNGGFAPVDPQSENAERIADTYWLVLALTGVVFVLVEGALIVFIVRFRNRGRPRTAEGPQIRGNTNLEIAWTVTPILILAAIAAFVFYKLPGIKDAPSARAGEQQLNITVEGRQFYWQFTYPGGQISIDRMVVPVGQVVTLDVVSPATDVVHSWWVPALGGKIDAIPGQTNRTWFRARRTGVYAGRCAELCGIEHTEMKAIVEVVSAADYRSFLASHRASSETVGGETFEGVCAKCHGLAGDGDFAPRIKGTATLTDRKALEELVRNGRPPGRTKTGMPAVGSGWSDAQIDALVKYVRGNPELGGAASGG